MYTLVVSVLCSSSSAAFMAKPSLSTRVTSNSLASAVNYTGVSALDTNVADWAFSDDTKVGDVEVIESADGMNYYVVYMVSTKAKDTTHTVDVRHILIGVADVTDTEAMAAAKAEAEELMAQWEENGASEEEFEEFK